ncbi:DUF401 family protein [Sediminispirochaeta bajacaliforniensis]|uniref:DUF401 family protein n=1 Tax=Sediminispirochaeta bajacaliforniensis TaxID=148 RepID=UPI0005249A16|nr:DUF401 family protein [Sediminispirochaeta bajacaliforniensis]
MTIPLMLKIILSLALILVLNKIVRNLAISVAAGALLIAFWSGQTIVTAGVIASKRMLSFDNFALLLLIALVITLSNQMNQTGMMKQLVGGLKTRVSQKGALAALPAVIGLLPMPGGALFSAPLIDDCDETGELSPMQKTKINYWFRHIWEFTWPLYPGVILASDIAHVEVWQIFLVGLPLSLISITAGYFFYLRPLELTAEKRDSSRKSNGPSLLSLLAPIIIVVVIYFLIMVFIPAVGNVSKYAPMIIGLLSSILYLQIISPLPGKEWKKIALSHRTFQMVLIVLVVRVYGAFIEAPLPNGTLLMEQLRLELTAAGVPLRLLVLLIPFISGMTTGVSVGFVGACFPIVFSLLGPSPTLASTLSTLALAYPFGFMGTMMSPVHVCLIVTNEHYGTNLGPSIGAVIPPAILVMAGSLLISYIIPFIV